MADEKAPQGELPPMRKDPAVLMVEEYFAQDHLRPGPLRDMSGYLREVALHILREAPASAERTVAVRKLLECKDAACRAVLPLQRKFAQPSGG